MFLRSSGLYRRFMEVFSSIASPVTRLIEKLVKFQWSDECEKKFAGLKTRLTTTPVLTLPESSYVYLIYCDVSRVGLGCEFMQRDKIIVYASRQLSFMRVTIQTMTSSLQHWCLHLIYRDTTCMVFI